MDANGDICNALGGEPDPHDTLTLYKSQFVGLGDGDSAARCLLCEETFILPTKEKDFLSHLFHKHRFVIGDVRGIACLKSYIYYWRSRFDEEPYQTFCTTLSAECTPDGQSCPNQHYVFLSDCIMEDKILRDELRRVNLERLLAKQQVDKLESNHVRGCIFCRTDISGSRVNYVTHLSQKHNFYLGKHEDLVFIDELLDKIQSNFENLICTYCEKTFKNRMVLKEHMRKKLHKRINPRNAAYDKFYISNYLEPGVTWRERKYRNQNPEGIIDTSTDSDEEDTSWSDWNGESVEITCLFCAHRDRDLANLLRHQRHEHGFDFERATKSLNFYHKVKLVNYIRKQVQCRRCIYCDSQTRDVLCHMKREGHYRIPERRVWDQPEFYFPPNEDDPFLYSLDVSDTSGDEVVEDSDVGGVVAGISGM